MDPSIAVNKMEDSECAGESALQASVSFGRFANDSLSWEKCSVFSADTPLDEVGKFSPAGSVAQKKAYFEAHYKNMAARKAEQEEKDKKKGIKVIIDHVDIEDETQRDSASEFSAVEPEWDVDKSNGWRRDNVIELESEVRYSKCEIVSSEVDEPTSSVDDIIDIKGVIPPAEDTKDVIPPAEDLKDEYSHIPGNSEVAESEEILIIEEEALLLGSVEVEEAPKHVDDTRVSDDKEERGKVKPENSLKSQKARIISTTGVKKTPTSSTPKSLVMPTPKLSRPTLSKTCVTPTAKTFTKKELGTSPMTSKKSNSIENRRAAPTSLHMSINLNPANSEPATGTTMRKSLIMESMGDKDIVKRAFKAFRSSSTEYSSPVKPSATSEIIGKETDAKASLVATPQKKTEGGNKLVKKPSPLSSGQTGLGKKSTPTRVSNTVSADQRNNKTVTSTNGLRSRDKADQGNKVSKKLEDKVNGKPSVRPQLQSKEKKELEIKRLQNSCSTKTKPVSATFASKTLA